MGRYSQPSSKQPSLFDIEPTVLPSAQPDLRADILHQIARDVTAAAEEDSPWWKNFFLERAEEYRQWYRCLTKEAGCPST